MEPYNHEAEVSILARCLTDEEGIVEAAPLLKPDDFYLREHQEIYKIMLTLSERHTPVDLVTVTEELRNGQIKIELAKLAEIAGSFYPANIEHYAQIIKENSYRRKLILVCNQLKAHAEDKDFESFTDFKDRVESSVLALHQESTGQLFTVKDLAAKKLDEIINRVNKKPAGLKTWIYDLDNLLLGMQPGDLVYLAARPSMGKTSLASQIAFCNVLNDKKIVYFATLEMTAEKIMEKMIVQHSGMPGFAVRAGLIDESMKKNLTRSAEKLAEGNRIFLDETACTVAEIRAKARRLKARKGLDLIIIDYVQLMSSGKKESSRTQEVSAISRGLKLLGKELGVPIIALSQLNRSAESRDDKRPRLSELRESGSLEQDADIVLFIHRDDYYRERVRDGEPGQKNHKAEIIIAKNRNGPIGGVEVEYLEECTLFVEDWVEAAKKLPAMEGEFVLC